MSPRNVSFDDLSLGADESPYDTESEIKDITPADQDMTKVDYDLIQAVNDNESLLVEARNLIMMMEFIYILKNKSLPKMVADALKDHLSELLSDTLKTILPELLKDSIKMVLTVEVPKLIIKPLNKELIALNTLENNRMVDLHKKLTQATKAIHTKVGKVVQRSVHEIVKSVRKEFMVVRELLKYCITMLDKADVNKKMALEEAKAQMKEIKRLELLKAEKVKDEKRADPLPITKISYRIDNSTTQATMRITRYSPLKSHSGKDTSCKNVEHPATTTANNILTSPTGGKWNEKRNLTLPEGVVGKEGMVIKELEAKIFLYNGNFDLVFQRRSEYALASTPQLIRIQNLIKRLAECKASACNEDSLSAKHQRAIKDSLSARPQQAPHTYLSQRHRQGSQRLLEDILVSWDGYQLAGQVNKALWQDKVVFDLKHELKYELVKVVNTWQNCSQKYGRDISKNERALNVVVLPPQDS
ncbi:hypothetical protein Tco_0418169 [Tanacetum coccineum]